MLLATEEGDDLLCVSDEFYGICLWNVNASLGLDGVDEGLERVDGRDVVVLLQIV